MTIVHGLNEKMMRLVNMTKSKWLKIGLNMTKTDEPYFFEHDRKVTMTNINLLNSTKNDRIWPKIENIIYPFILVVVILFFYSFLFGHIQPFMFVVVAIFIKFLGHVQQVNIHCCHFSVMFKDFGHIHSVILIRSS